MIAEVLWALATVAIFAFASWLAGSIRRQRIADLNRELGAVKRELAAARIRRDVDRTVIYLDKIDAIKTELWWLRSEPDDR